MSQSSLTELEMQLYARLRDALEAYETLAWELERIDEAPLGSQDAARDVLSGRLAAELLEVQRAVVECTQALQDAKTFGGEVIDANGIAHAVQHRIERDVLEAADARHPGILKRAALESFLDAEKASRSVIYKKRFRGGFKERAETLIGLEQKKNAAERDAALKRLSAVLTPADLELIMSAFGKRMARHGLIEKKEV